MKKILLVDDDKDLLRALGARLRTSGYEVAFATDGVSCISAAVKESPSLILLDVGLPAGDGYKCLEKLQANLQLNHIPVVMLTGREGPAVQERCMREGARGFLQKPVRKEDLLEVIETTLVQSESSCAS